tara:strand:+ start:248 stop:595 length:348 start_codon:yes stop_codon:yes gene_type:complete
MNKEEYKEQFGILLTENSELKKQVLELTMELAELKDIIEELGGNDMISGLNKTNVEYIKSNKWEITNDTGKGDFEVKKSMIYESPDGGETVYGRRFNEYKNRTLIKDPRDISEDE